ncbi:hypothetical protein [Telluribacter humicola]|uniref:hypothetical protein n=1 Tax=Telluribacter humicola TaxID=1720261 RepID=UPI001A95D51A|nr:hypothetical protein [Telluribacter humicola]
MFRIESDLTQIALVFSQKAQLLENSWGDHLVEAAGDGIAAVTHRIQQKGENTSGNQMITQSAKRSGAYSRAYAAYRSRQGRQIGKVDFTMEGDLMRNYQIIYRGMREVVVGFMDADMNEIALYLEAYFGAAWYLSVEEQKVVMDSLSIKVFNHFN